LGVYNQSSVNGLPSLVFPSPFPSNLGQPGSFAVYASTDIHYHDPYVQQFNFTIERDLGQGIGLRLTYVGSHGSQLTQLIDQNQVPYNTVGYAVAGPQRPFPGLGILEEVTNGGYSNYNAATIDLKRRFFKGLQFEINYTFTRDLSNEGGADPTAFAGATGALVSDSYNRSLDYGNVAYDRRNRFLVTFLYELPVGRGKTFLNNANGFVDRVLGGWQLGGVLTLESGPFLTVVASGPDPGGTNYPTVIGNPRADTVAGVSPYLSNGNPLDFLNPAAFSAPASNIGRAGDSAVGAVVGPNLHALSLSLLKSVAIREGVRMRIGISGSNILNQVNYGVPALTINTSSYGIISGLNTGEGAGPRFLQATARIEF
jgi:hypothetical protein